MSKKVDYALVSLAHLVQNPAHVASAREIAQQHGLPLPLLMQILKRLHQRGVLASTRGVKGGYQIAIDLDDLSLARLIEIIESADDRPTPMLRKLSIQPPVQALQFKLVSFLRGIKVTDLIKPGRRIDVPLERVRFAEKNNQPILVKELA